MSDSQPLGQSACRLHRWEKFTDDEGLPGLREVVVDHRSALSDALLGYDVPTSDVLREFERMVADSAYTVGAGEQHTPSRGQSE